MSKIFNIFISNFSILLLGLNKIQVFVVILILYMVFIATGVFPTPYAATGFSLQVGLKTHFDGK